MIVGMRRRSILTPYNNFRSCNTDSQLKPFTASESVDTVFNCPPNNFGRNLNGEQYNILSNTDSQLKPVTDKESVDTVFRHPPNNFGQNLNGEKYKVLPVGLTIGI
jgi:DNA modification methylase